MVQFQEPPVLGEPKGKLRLSKFLREVKKRLTALQGKEFDFRVRRFDYIFGTSLGPIRNLG